MKFAVVRNYIITANDEGMPWINSKIVVKINMNDYNDKLLTTLIEQANMLHESLVEVQPEKGE